MVSQHSLWVSSDFGSSWFEQIDGIEYDLIQDFTSLAITPKYYYLGTTRGLYKSPAYPVYWTRLENGSFYHKFPVKNVEAVDNTVMVGEQYPQNMLYFSYNYGYSFDDFSDFYRFTSFNDTYYLLKDSILYSEDETHTWEYIPYNFNHNLYTIDRIEDTVIVAGRTTSVNPVIQISYTLGESWTDIVDNLPYYNPYYASSQIEQIKMFDGRVYAGNPNGGLWYRDDLIVGIKKHADPSYNENLKIYPNPTDHYMNIRYPILDTRYSILIYDMFGRLVDEILIASGKKENRIDVSAYPDGIYVVILLNETGILGRQKFVLTR